MLVLLTLDAVLDMALYFVLHTAERVVSFDEFYRTGDTWVAVERVVVVATYDIVLEILWYLR